MKINVSVVRIGIIAIRYLPKLAPAYIKCVHLWSGKDPGNNENGSILTTARESKRHITLGSIIRWILPKVGGASGSIHMDSCSTPPKKGASRCSTASLRGNLSSTILKYTACDG